MENELLENSNFIRKTWQLRKMVKSIKQKYDKYMKTHLTQAEKDYLEIMGEDIKKLNGWII